MRPTAALVLAMLSLAGCSNGSPSSDDTPAGSSATTSTGPIGEAAPAWQDSLVAVAFDGMLSHKAHACVFPAGQCPTTPPVGAQEKSDYEFTQAGANLTGVDLTVTWTGNPATQRLAAGFMHMTDCDGCEDTAFDEIEGASPLRLSLADVDLPLNDSAVLHVYVYNPTLLQVFPGGVGYMFATTEQAFRIEGTVAIRAPAA